MDIPHILWILITFLKSKPNPCQNYISSVDHWLCSAQDICSFSDFEEQTVHPEGLSGFCWKFPPAPCALLCSYHSCWLQPRHQPNLSEAFLSGSSVCSNCNYITVIFGKHTPAIYVWIYWEIRMEQQRSSPNFSIQGSPFPPAFKRVHFGIAGDAQSSFSSKISLLCTKWF